MGPRGVSINQWWPWAGRNRAHRPVLLLLRDAFGEFSGFQPQVLGLAADRVGLFVDLGHFEPVSD